MSEMAKNLADWFFGKIETASANIKLVDQALTGMEGSYVELLTLLALGLLAVVPVIVPENRRQFYRRVNQLFGIFIFIFVVYTCMGVFGMIRNFHRGLMEIGRENIIALYFVSVPLVIMSTSMIFGPAFCGWICPTGALQEFSGMLFNKCSITKLTYSVERRRKALILTFITSFLFLLWILYLSLSRVFFIEDASIYWSEALIILLFILCFRIKEWDGKLRRLRVLSFLIITAAAVAGWRITSPVHFTFSKVYDPASLLSTVMVILGAFIVPSVWCRYMCPWREAIAWAGKHSARKLETDFSKCTACGACNNVCSVEAIFNGRINGRECHFCLKCADICPQKAIHLKEKWQEAD